jgi:hypothetical protein
MQGKLNERIAHEFICKVMEEVRSSNQVKTRLQVLITGRELVIQDNQNNFHKRNNILNILPYYVQMNKRSSYHDPDQLLASDQRQVWWKKYGIVSGSGHKKMPSELDHEQLVEITAQPLLNYFLSLTHNNNQ